MKKRWAAFLVAFLFAFQAVALSEENVTVQFPSSTGGNAGEMSLTWSDAYFLADAAVYQHELAKLSLGMALAAFRGDESAPDAGIRRFFETLGFSAPDVRQYDVKLPDSIGTAIAHRSVAQGEASATLVAIAVSGGNYGQEWLSNFDCGTGDLHKGFSESAQKVVDRAAAYVAENQIQNPIFWISGYSRGAAVSNLTAAFLQAQGLAADASIFAYTFATPRTVMAEKAAAHPNIFNIVNAADLVPQVPLAAWGYGRYGQTLYLPSSLSQNLDYAALLPGYAAAYEQLTGQADAGAGDGAFAPMAALAAKGLSIAASSPEKYAATYQAILSKLFIAEELTGAESIILMTMLMTMSNAVFSDQQTRIDVTKGLEGIVESLSALLPIFYQHMPEIYGAWMLSLPDGAALLENSLNLTEEPFI